MSGELETPYGIAQMQLLDVRAKKQLRQIVSGKQTDLDRAKALREFLERNPDLIKPNPTPVDRAILAGILLEELSKSEDTNAIRLVFKSGHIAPAFAKKHLQAMLEYARTLKGEEAVLNTRLIERLLESEDKSVITLFERWAPHATSAYQKSYIQTGIRELQKAGKI